MFRTYKNKYHTRAVGKLQFIS